MLGAESWTPKSEDFATPIGGAWTGLGQRLAVPRIGLDSDWTGLGQRFAAPRAGLVNVWPPLRRAWLRIARRCYSMMGGPGR